MSSNFRTQETRQRLLEAAADVFAETGYRNATFRGICERAQANIAAVNYHFQDKQRFYSAVVEHVIEQEKDTVAELQSRVEAPAPPEARLQAYIHFTLNCLLGASPPARLLRLLAHEMMEPTPTLDFMVEKVVMPTQQNLWKTVSEILGQGADQRLIVDCASSITSQCFIYYHSRAVVARMGVYPAYDQPTIDHLAEHITQFSLGALRAVRETLERAATLGDKMRVLKP